MSHESVAGMPTGPVVIPDVVAALASGAGVTPVWRNQRVRHSEARLGAPPPIDHLVVCHGDACAPNTLLHDDGTFAAHVDLGSLGVTDRWADLAVAAWSTEWNYGPGYDGFVYAAYGLPPDPAASPTTARCGT